MIDENSHVHGEEMEILEYLSLMAAHRHYLYRCDHGNRLLKGYCTSDIALPDEKTGLLSQKMMRKEDLHTYRIIGVKCNAHFAFLITFEINNFNNYFV